MTARHAQSDTSDDFRGGLYLSREEAFAVNCLISAAFEWRRSRVKCAAGFTDLLLIEAVDSLRALHQTPGATT
jgi:hypothetical protein